MTRAFGRLSDVSRVRLAHAPTPIEPMDNLSDLLGGARIYVKRDDCTGLAFGGNKIRQLEFYFGDALAKRADTVLISGAVQSNFVRSAAAAAAKLGLACHVQLEERVAAPSSLYRSSGNVLLDHLLGATVHTYPQGEDEAGADRRVREIAEDLASKGRRPYVIPLSPGHPPLGALGYVVAAQELATQFATIGFEFDEIFVASGSGSTHGGLVYGLRACGVTTPVTGVCVRRSADIQERRIVSRLAEIAELLETSSAASAEDIVLTDAMLAPGYGTLNPAVSEAIALGARREAIFVDPIYTGRVLAETIRTARLSPPESRVLFIHTGGQPALFAYADQLDIGPGTCSET